MVRGAVVLLSFVLLIGPAAGAAGLPRVPRILDERPATATVLESVRFTLRDLFRNALGLFANNGMTTDPNGRPYAPPQGGIANGGGSAQIQ